METAEEYLVDDNAAYHADTDSISKSMLNLYCDSPVEYKLTFVTGELARKAPTKPMLTGTILHAVLLEGKTLEDVVGIYTDDCFKSNGTINPKPASQFRDEIFPRIAVKRNELYEIAACLDSIAGSELWKAVKQASEHERRHDGNVAGVPCRCKPDMLCDMGDHILIYDLKFCDPSRGAFVRSAKRFRYWLQDAHYSAVLTAETGKPVVFRFFAVEPTFPFRVQCYWYGARQREIARDYHLRMLGKLSESIATGIFEDNWGNELPLDVWDVGERSDEVEPELEGFDDE